VRLSRRAGQLFRIGLSAILLAAVVRSFLVQPFSIPTSSMEPLLQPGDFVMVNKARYGWSLASLPSAVTRFAAGEAALGLDRKGRRIAGRAPARGDVILFVGDPVRGLDYVKRVIAVPGDRLAIVDGELWLNGERISCDPVAPDLCREQLPGGRSHLVRPDRSAAGQQMPELLVPAGHYFVMGDNRGNSADSRLSVAAGGLGFVPHERLVGEARHIFFSMDPERLRLRPGRVGSLVD
ncbi:MAG: signal peptidase I, partial [Sphingomonadaceae bacterium]